MPLYDYDCANCGHRFEVIHGVHADGPTNCPSCGKGPVRKAITAAAVHYKGSGWAKKERRAKVSSGSGSSSGSSSGSESSGSDHGSSSDTSATSSADKDMSSTTSTAKAKDKTTSDEAGARAGSASGSGSSKTADHGE